MKYHHMPLGNEGRPACGNKKVGVHRLRISKATVTCKTCLKSKK